MKTISTAIYYIIVTFSVLTSLYVGGWRMLIQPIIELCKYFDAGALTGAIICTTALKCICAGTVGAFIVYAGVLAAVFVSSLIETIGDM